ncbi:MAG TPA: lipoate--protein ligase family protein [Xanthomonadales bacterium]|nr:lipoate--protein ligase family protein [Xanthomonadales bacterium]
MTVGSGGAVWNDGIGTVTNALRVLDTGVLEGRLNIALGQALVESHQAGQSPDTLRFLRFPPTALVGRHQALGQELDLDYCHANGIGTARRITGGGAIFLDPGQLGWEIVISRRTLGKVNLADVTRAMCEAAAAGLCTLGVEAAYRPRNDIEVGGRKISGTGGFFDGDTLFFQGTVLVDMNPQLMVSALRVPQAKLEKRSLGSAAQRVVTLRELLGEATPTLSTIQQVLARAFAARLDLTVAEADLTEAERARGQQLFGEEIGTEDFVNEIDQPDLASGILAGEHTGAGGTIRSYLRLEGPAHNTVREALITGDFFVTPPRVVYDLEASLRRVNVGDIGATAREFFATTSLDVLSVTPEDFICSLENALASRHAGAASGKEP